MGKSFETFYSLEYNVFLKLKASNLRGRFHFYFADLYSARHFLYFEYYIAYMVEREFSSTLLTISFNLSILLSI